MHINSSDAMIFDEIIGQGQAWRELIPIVLDQRQAIEKFFEGIDEVLFIGCGSSLNASYTASVIFQTATHKGACAVPAAELVYFPQSIFRKNHKTSAVLMSRSGKTSEIVQALNFLRKNNIPTIGVTCHEHSPLAEGCELSLVLTPALEQAVPTTRSVTGMIMTAQFMAAIVSGNDDEIANIQHLADKCQELMPEYQAQGQKIGNLPEIDRFAFVGNGPYYGLARESQLKVKEMTLQPSDAYPMFDFRHGPQSTVDEHMLITVLLSDSARLQEIRFVQDMKKLGGVLWVICDQSDEMIEKNADSILELNSGYGDMTRLPLYLPAVQFMAYYHAQQLGLDPDKPHNLAYWIDLSGK